MATPNGHEIGCTCEACCAPQANNRASVEIAPGISKSPGVVGAPYLLIHCGGFFSQQKIRCRAALEVPLPIVDLAELLLDVGWVGSAAMPIGSSKNVLVPLCGACARLIYGDALVAAARRTRPQKPGTA